MAGLLVFLGGGIGALLRFLVCQFFHFKSFPFATLVSNVLSCIVFVIALAAIKGNVNERNLYLFLITGLCGGFSTFSTFSFETFSLLKSGQTLFALINIISSLLCCLLVFYLAYIIFSKAE